MTDLSAHHARILLIRQKHWLAGESYDDELERYEEAQVDALDLFNGAVAEQASLYRLTIESLAWMHSPRMTRLRKAAVDRFHDTTADARRLYEDTIAEVMRSGTISQFTRARWSALSAAKTETVQ